MECLIFQDGGSIHVHHLAESLKTVLHSALLLGQLHNIFLSFRK
jgi:hypothetical protein